MDSKLKDLLPILPVIYVKAVPVQPTWEPSAVGYLRHVHDIYECPVSPLLSSQPNQSTNKYIPQAWIVLTYCHPHVMIQVYMTSFRGPTYVFLSTLKSADPVSKWVLTGTAILMQTDD